MIQQHHQSASQLGLMRKMRKNRYLNRPFSTIHMCYSLKTLHGP